MDIPALIELIEQNSDDLTDTETGCAQQVKSYYQGQRSRAFERQIILPNHYFYSFSPNHPNKYTFYTPF
jgi:hypothetical protein